MPTRESYSGQVSVDNRRSQMEDGQFAQRRRWASLPFRYNLVWKLTFKQAEMFEAWLEYEVKVGTTFIYAEVPLMGRTVNVRPVTGMPSYSPKGASWIVTMEVEEKWDKPIVPKRTGVLPQWPDALPDLESVGFTLSKINAITVSDIEGGIPDMRERFRDQLSQYQGTLILNQSQRDVFWRFFKDDLIGGLSWFNAPFANARSQEHRRARIVNNQAVESAQGSWYSVAITLETTNTPLMSREEYFAGFVFINDYVEAGYVVDGYVGRYE